MEKTKVEVSFGVHVEEPWTNIGPDFDMDDYMAAPTEAQRTAEATAQTGVPMVRMRSLAEAMEAYFEQNPSQPRHNADPNQCTWL